MNNLGWGLQMTVLGMGLVFAVLALLWGLLTLVLKLDKAPADEAATPSTIEAADLVPDNEPVAVAGPSTRQVNGMDADLVAAILVATLTHKAARRREAAPAMRSFWPGSQLYASRWVASGRARQNNVWRGRG